MGGYARNGDVDVAMELFDEMRNRDIHTHRNMVDEFNKGVEGLKSMALEGTFAMDMVLEGKLMVKGFEGLRKI
ncbi:hypothetical protein RJT34_17276 [Clitoria ternatea]|uniref:Pentatricopeptide repeat-containing protein n=1 Tax=Clitoria ternatea TaxID=43366 RepID=A0AAN9J8N6_CLITE